MVLNEHENGFVVHICLGGYWIRMSVLGVGHYDPNFKTTKLT